MLRWTVRNITGSREYIADNQFVVHEPEKYKGHVGDVSMFLRIAVTGKMNSPDMYSVMQVMGEDKVRARIADMTAKL